MTIARTYALSHFATHSLNYSHTHSLTKWPYRLHMLSVTSPNTHLITVRRVHLPNDHIAYLRPQSLPRKLNRLQSHAFTYKYSSTHHFVKHSNHLHTKATHPLTHTQSLYLWPVILLPCLFKHHATRSQIHVLVQPTKLQNHTTLKPTAIFQMYSDVKILLV
jgi:hypothetical protein